MNFPARILLAVSIAALTFASSFADAQAAKPFSRYDLYQYISGKTQRREDALIFYFDSGKLLARKAGECARGKWSTTEQGGLCWHVSAWGEQPCENYFSDGALISVVREGKNIPAPQLEDGNTLDCPLWASGTVLTGVEPVEDFGDGLFNREQTRQLIAGKTVVMGPNRGLYYGADSRLEKNWDGVRSTGSWKIDEHGAVCWQLPGWGPTPCESYYLKEGEMMSWFNRKRSKARKHLEGNQLGKL